MITPVSALQPPNVESSSAPQQQGSTVTSKSGTLSQDQVTLESAGQVDPDQDGD